MRRGARFRSGYFMQNFLFEKSLLLTTIILLGDYLTTKQYFGVGRYVLPQILYIFQPNCFEDLSIGSSNLTKAANESELL